MSYAEPKVIMGRIAAATKQSPIAVFTCEKEGCLNAVFANTAMTVRQIRDRTGLVGVYDNTMDKTSVYMDLRGNAAR